MIKKIFNFLFKNSSEEQRITKNSFWLALARFGGSLCRAFLIIYAFRTLGPSLQGSFSLAMNFILIFSFIPDFGLTAILIRELAKNQRNKQETLANAFLAVFILLIFSLIIINTSKFFFIKDELAKKLIFILTIFLIFDTLREFLYAIFRFQEKMEFQAYSHLTTNFALLVLGISFLKINPSPFSLSQGYLLASIIGFLLTIFFLRKEIFFNYFKFIKLKLSLELLNKSWPIGIANFLFLVLTYVDTLIIGWFHSPKDVGLYNSVVKLSEFLYFFPAALAMSIFPILSKKEPDKFKETINYGFQFAIFISLPIWAGIFILAKDIILFIFGDKYLSAVLALQFISFSIPLNFLILILIDTLIAIDKRKELLIYDIIIVIFNIILNLIFVPYYTYFASSLITSLSSLLALIFSFLIVKKYVPINFKNLKITNYLLATFLMIILSQILKINLIIKIIVLALSYFSILYILRDSIIFKSQTK